MLISETISIRKFKVTKEDLNYVGILFGGKLLAELDVTLAKSTYKYSPSETLTGSVDKVRFIKPFHEGETVTIKAMVSGHSDRVIEVLGQVFNEKEELCAYGVFSFVVIDRNVILPELRGENEFEQKLLEGFTKRQKNERELHQMITDKLILENNIGKLK